MKFSSPANPPRVAVVGAGWAGLAAAVQAHQLGHQVTLLEATRTPGGRARSVTLPLPNGHTLQADNGQHILIGAYTDTLRLMRTVGADPAQLLQRLPLTLRYPDGSGLSLPRLPRPLDAAVGILGTRGWPLQDRLTLLRTAIAWRRNGFACDPALTVAVLCQTLPTAVRHDFIDPLCVAALNTPPAEASAQVFLRVLHDALLGPPGSADLLLPRTELGALWPEPAIRWLQAEGVQVRWGSRIDALHAHAGQSAHAHAGRWQIGSEIFDRVVLAVPAHTAARIAAASNAPDSTSAAALQRWSAQAAALHHEAIATVYALVADPGPDLTPHHPSGQPWPTPMLALRADGSAQAPAQFVFDRSALLSQAATGTPAHNATAANTPHHRLLAFVISAARDRAAALEAGVTAQARAQLGLVVTPLRTIVEKRATFACTPGLQRPPMQVAPGLLACGDFIDGPYPATLEGAVRSGLQAAEALR